MNDNNEESRMITTREKAELKYLSCERVYGTCTDGSFEACMYSKGSYHELIALAEIEEQAAQDAYLSQSNKQTFHQSI